jgi:hypothetical protein
MRTILQMHGCGYGDDGPLFNTRFHGQQVGDVQMEAGNAFVWKPIAASADGKIQFTWGGPLMVTETSAETLFNRPHGMAEIDI